MGLWNWLTHKKEDKDASTVSPSPKVQEILQQAQAAGTQAGKEWDMEQAESEACFSDANDTQGDSGLDYDPFYGDSNLTADEEEWEEWDSFKRLEKKHAEK